MQDAIIGKEVMPTGQPREIFRIVPTEHGFDVVIADGITLSQAAEVFINAVSRRLGKRLPNTWIPVAQELPDVGRWVIVFGRSPDNLRGWQRPAVGRWSGVEWEQDAGQIINDLEGKELLPDDPKVEPFPNVTHWMPLPEAPKEEK